jgi:hypothetical protein
VHLKQISRLSRSQGEFGTILVPPGYLPKNRYFYHLPRVFAFLNLPVLPSRVPSCQICFCSLGVFSVGLMTSHVRHKSTNMAVRDVTTAGGRYGEANLEQIDENTHKSNKYTV